MTVLERITQHYIANRSKYVKRMTFRSGNPATGEDVVQSAYELAIKYQKGLGTGNIDAWMSTIMNNCLRAHQNAEKGYSYRDEEAEETTDDVSCPHYPARVMDEVFELIDTKSVVQIEVLELYFKQEYSAIDISKITVHSYDMVRQIIHRFRNELKELYKE